LKVWSVWWHALSWRALVVVVGVTVAAWWLGLAFDGVRGGAGSARIRGELQAVGSFELVSLGFLQRDGASVAGTPVAMVFAPKAWEALFVDAPLSGSLLLLLLSACGGIGAMGVARLTALSIAGDVVGDWGEAWFGLRRVASVTSGLVFVLLAIGVGWVLWLVGGGKSGVVAVLVLVAWALLMPLWAIAIGAFACEGSDGADAQHRTLAYVVARPGLALHLALGVVLQFCVIGAVITLVAWASASAGIAGAWADAGLMGGLAASAMAFAGAGGAVVYLRLRYEVDGQRIGDVWSPEGVAGGTFSGASAQDD
jgi:hypothetical protein